MEGDSFLTIIFRDDVYVVKDRVYFVFGGKFFYFKRCSGFGWGLVATESSKNVSSFFKERSGI